MGRTSCQSSERPALYSTASLVSNVALNFAFPGCKWRSVGLKHECGQNQVVGAYALFTVCCTWMDVGGDKEVEDAAGTFLFFFHFEAESHYVALAALELTM